MRPYQWTETERKAVRGTEGGLVVLIDNTTDGAPLDMLLSKNVSVTQTLNF